MSRLSPAYQGYVHQDVLTAYALAALLLPRTTDRAVIGDRKAVPGDRFDDLAIHGAARRRTQVKSHTTDNRRLGLADLTTNRIDFRIDHVVRSFIEDSEPADEYRLVATFGEPDRTLAPYVRPLVDRGPLLPGLRTQRFSLDVARIWPAAGDPQWANLKQVGREALARFCERFVIETGCPASSGDLRVPGPLEDVLLRFLYDRIGVGRPPNHHRDLADAAAQLIHFAQAMRTSGTRRTADEVIAALALRVDYGRVEEYLPVDEHRLVRRDIELDALIGRLGATNRVAVVGPPGAGKSWLLHLLRKRLLAEGWVVAVHFCFVDLFDNVRERRATVEATFGSVIAELLDADPSLASDRIARFAAGPRELEDMLAAAQEERRDRRIAIVVDGLDHADRVLTRGVPGAAADIAQELAVLQLPPGVVLIVGSQPGDHLGAFLSDAELHSLGPWADDEIRTLADRAGVGSALVNAGLEHDAGRVLDAVADRSRGNPLYATYLTRTVVQLASGIIIPADDPDIAAHLAAAPSFDSDLNAYYRWLLDGIRHDTGALFVAQLISLIDFPATAEELGEIDPLFAHLVPVVLARLAPVLAEDPALGGLRVYHESFQRFVRETLTADPNVDPGRALTSAIEWLERRGFLEDRRAFRSLLVMLRAAGRDRDVVKLVGVDFVAAAAAHGHPGDAVIANLTVAAASAAALGSWADLARLVELSRTADYLYNWRLDVDDELAEAYGRAFAARFGANALADRLLHEGRCTFRPRPGLVLCRMCEENGVAAPWTEYRTAHDRQRRTDTTSYSGGETAIEYARLTGRFRLEGRENATALAAQRLRTPDELPVHPFDVVHLLGEMYGVDAVETVVAALEPGSGRAWAHLAAAEIVADQQAARDHADAALDDSLPPAGIRACLRLGADPLKVADLRLDLDQLTADVCTREVQYREGLLGRWLAGLDVAAALGDHAALFRAETLIPSDTWFRRWLRFAVTLRTANAGTAVRELTALATDVEVFKGDPRVVDLYALHGDIRESFRGALEWLEDAHWSDAVDALAQISTATSRWLARSRSGPLPLDAFFELCLATADTDAKRRKAGEVAAELLAPGQRTGELYDTHAHDQLLLVRLHAAAGERDLAEAAWNEACVYLAGYGWRKDITVYELLDPLQALGAADPVRVRGLLRAVQPVVEGVLVHTDGRETSHAIHRWVDTAAKLHPAGALAYLAKKMLVRSPSFGDLDHALPAALAAMTGTVPDIVLAAGWMAAGSEARRAPEDALRACERAADGNPALRECAWSTVAAALAGDGVGPASGTATLIGASAARLGRAVPAVTGEAEQSEPESPGYKSPWHEVSISPQPPFMLTVDSPSVRVAHAVRRWRELLDRGPVDTVINAVGWRLIALEHEGRGHEAETLIRRLARDTPPWKTDGVLSGLAEGLARYGATHLAAIAYTFAYTRARDGWRRFAGVEAQDLFMAALGLDASLAWSTLADEVADGVARGGEYGTTVHLIELLAAGGLVDEAFAAWEAACRVVLTRLPPTGPADDIDVCYDDAVDDPGAALAEAVAARLNHSLVHERRAAMVGASLVASADGRAFGGALRLAAEHAPPSVLVTLLDIAFEYERPPYWATVAADVSLRDLATGDLVSARVLARRLLERAGRSVPMAPPRTLPSAVSIDDQRAQTLEDGIGRNRIGPIEAVWPAFGRLAAERLDLILKSPELRSRMQAAARRLGHDRKGRNVRLWLPADEERERVLQTTGAAVRTVLASEGIIDPNIEEEIGTLLLADLCLGVRLALGRTARPDHHLRPADAPSFATEAGVRMVPDGDFGGWVVLAHHEQQLIVGDGYRKPVEARLESWSSLQFTESPVQLNGNLPVGYGQPDVWLTPAPLEATPGLFQGPVGGYDIQRDPFGVIELLAPHPVVVLAARLSPAPFEQGLTLIDEEGDPGVVCHVWRQGLLGDRYLDDHEHKLAGIELLARADVVDAAARWALGDPEHIVTSSARSSPTSS
jgi:hypothetical protein